MAGVITGSLPLARLSKLGSLGVQRVGAFAYIGQAPTLFQFTQNGVGVAGTGIGNKSFYRDGLIGMWYIKNLDITTMYFHGWDSAFLGVKHSIEPPRFRPTPTAWPPAPRRGMAPLSRLITILIRS